MIRKSCIAGALIIASAAIIMTCPTAALSGAYDQLRSIAGGGGNVPPVGAPQCVSGCGRPAPPPPVHDDSARREAEKREAERRKAEERQRVESMDDANEKGIDCYERRDWQCAIRNFELALQYSPHNPAIISNLNKAKEKAKQQQNMARPPQYVQPKPAPAQPAPKPAPPLVQKPAPQPAPKWPPTKEQEIQTAKKRLYELQHNIKTIQGHLRTFSKTMLNNNSQLESWENTVDVAVKDTWDKGTEYLLSLPFDYGTYKLEELAKARAAEIDKEALRALEELTGTTDPAKKARYRAAYHWLKKEQKIANYELTQLNNLGALKTTYDLYAWDISRDEDYKKTIEGLSWLAGIISKPFSHIKMSVEAYTNVISECVAWRNISQITKKNEAYSKKVKELSFRMEKHMKETECLQTCIGNYSDGCVNRCRGGSRLHTPPPML